MRELFWTKVFGAILGFAGLTGIAFAHSPRQTAVSLFFCLLGVGLLIYVGWKQRTAA